MADAETSIRSELLGASDAQIEEAVKFAEAMVLRGLIYQLTGDESLAAVVPERIRAGYSEFDAVTNPVDVAAIQSKAADFLKRYRDAGAKPISPGPPERMRRSLSLAAGAEIPTDELEMWLEQTGIDPFARALAPDEQPDPTKAQSFKVAVVGAGMSGLNAAVLLKRAGLDYRVFEKNAGVGGTWYENVYPGARVDSPSRAYTHAYGVECSFPYTFNTQAENLKYLDWVADRFGIRRNIDFHTEVIGIFLDVSAV